MQDFAAKTLVIILDSLEKVVQASVAKAIAISIGDDPTPLGLVQGALAAAAIEVAFKGAEAVITASTAKPFATGGIVPGQGNSDSVPAILTPGEIVMNKAASTELAPVLSYLNSLYGGANFAPGYQPSKLPVSTPDGGLIARTLGAGAMPTAAEIGREVGKNVPREIGVSAINQAQARQARVRQLTSLS